MIDKRKLNFIISTWACYSGRRTHCSLQSNYQKLVEEAPSTLNKFLFVRKNGQSGGKVVIGCLFALMFSRFNRCHHRNTTENFTTCVTLIKILSTEHCVLIYTGFPYNLFQQTIPVQFMRSA